MLKSFFKLKNVVANNPILAGRTLQYQDSKIKNNLIIVYRYQLSIREYFTTCAVYSKIYYRNNTIHHKWFLKN